MTLLERVQRFFWIVGCVVAGEWPVPPSPNRDEAITSAILYSTAKRKRDVLAVPINAPATLETSGRTTQGAAETHGQYE